MFKKTTLYLADEDIYLVKKLSILKNMTIAETIRLAIRNFCKPSNKTEERIWDDLDNLWSKIAKIENESIEKAITSAVKEVRHGKKTNRHT